MAESRRCALLVALTALLLSACGGEDALDPPSIFSFTAEPLRLEEGQTTTLRWSAQNAERVTITSTQGVELQNTETLEGELQSPPLLRSTAYVLTAQRGELRAFSTVFISVRVVAQPMILSFTADPIEILESETATLTWQTQDAVRVDIATSDGLSIVDDAELNGSFAVSPRANTTYVLRAMGEDDSEAATAEVRVTVVDARPMIRSFTAEPESLVQGQPGVLRWAVDSADFLRITSADQTVYEGPDRSGNAEITPLMTTAYTLTATNAFGASTATVTVTVAAPGDAAIVRFDASPNPTEENGTTTLSWQLQNATMVRVLEDGMQIFTSSAAVPMGQLEVSPPAPITVYTLQALNPASTSSAALTVYTQAPPQIVSFDVTPPSFSGASNVQVSWDVQSFNRLELLANGQIAPGFTVLTSSTTALNDAGSLTLNISETTRFSLIAISAGGLEMQERFSVNGSAESEPNDGFMQAQTLPGDGSDAAGAITPVGDEDWYAVVVPAAGNVRAETLPVGGCGTNVELTLFAPDGSTALVSAMDAGNCALLDPSVEAAARNLNAGTYYVRVRAGPGTTSYVLSVTAGGPSCGNNILEGTEACDDGNLVPEDGCNATCDLEGVPEDEAGGNDVPAGAGVPRTSVDQTYFGRIDPLGDVDVFGIDIPQGFHLEASLTVDSLGTCPADPRAILTLIAPDGITELATNSDGGPQGNCGRIGIDTTPEAFSMNAGLYFLRVEELGADALINTYFLNIQIVSPGCGNALVEPGETCDDGNTADNDGCDSDCMFELSPLVIQPPGGTVNANLQTPGSSSVVRVNLTQNGQSITATAADIGLTSCDQVDTGLTLMTLTFDTLGSSANGGPTGAAGDCASLTPQSQPFAADLPAGSYHLQVRNEGNTTGAVQVGITITDPACGNGIREATVGEQCDDGNTVPGDGCSDTCTLEGGSITEVEPNDSQATATPTGLVGPGLFTVVGANNPSGDDDVYSLVVPPGAALRLSARTYSMAGVPTSCDIALTDTRIFLEIPGAEATAPNTGELVFNDDIDNANNIWCSGFSGALLNPGTYYVRVQGWNDTQLTQYLMDLTLSP